ncbi:hypothetical protein [Microcoleus sp. T3_A4]
MSITLLRPNDIPNLQATDGIVCNMEGNTEHILSARISAWV